VASFALAGCASDPCRTRYFHTINDGAVRIPPSAACVRRHERQHAAVASSDGDAR
jgi:hypothetical protein